MINRLSLESMLQMRGGAVLDRNGEDAGTISDIYYDRDTRVPEWVGVTRDFWGGKQVLVPVFEANTREGALHVPYERAAIESAPQMDAREIDESTERRIYEHYGIAYSQHASSSGLPEGMDVSTGSGEAGGMRSHVATRWSWPDEHAAMPMAGTSERLGEESRVDAQGVRASETVSPETMAPFPSIEPEREAEAATAPDNAPGPPRADVDLRTPSRPNVPRETERGFDAGRQALDQEAVVMSDKPADLPGTLYDTSPSGMKGGGRRTAIRNTAITMSALAAGLLFLRQMRRRRQTDH